MKIKNKFFLLLLLIVAILQIGFISFLLFYKNHMTPKLEWQHALSAAIYTSGDSSTNTSVQVEAMIPYKSPFYVDTHARWYEGMLTIVSASFLEESNFKEMQHEIISSTSTFMKYRIYNESGMEWIIWLDLVPIISTNSQPRIAIERRTDGGGI